MNLKNLQQSIKTSLQIINSAIKQVPKDKQTLLIQRVNNVLNKYIKGGQSQQILRKFNKQLQFNLNFIKLSHPNLDFSIKNTAQAQNQQKQQKQKNQQNNNTTNNNNQGNKQFQHKFQVVDQSGINIQRLNTVDTFDQQIDRQKGVREQVQFSNWFDGNVDPEMMRKHKKLLERQHFQGQFWKDKQPPKSIAKQYLKSAMAAKIQQGDKAQMPKKQKILQGISTQNIQQSQQVWQKVKR